MTGCMRCNCAVAAHRNSPTCFFVTLNVSYDLQTMVGERRCIASLVNEGRRTAMIRKGTQGIVFSWNPVADIPSCGFIEDTVIIVGLRKLGNKIRGSFFACRVQLGPRVDGHGKSIAKRQPKNPKEDLEQK